MERVEQVTPEEFEEELHRGDNILILDVRNEEEYRNWRIEGKSLEQILHIPYFVFLEEEEASLKKISHHKDMVVVCTEGGASDYLAQMLNSKGFRAKNLEGGMIAWSELYKVKPIPDKGSSSFFFLQIQRVGKGCLSYIMGCDDEALVIDPSRHIHHYLKIAQKEGLVITHVIDTHLQADHISGGISLSQATKAKYYFPPEDARDSNFSYIPMTDQKEIIMGKGKVRIRAIHSPGHTPGSTCLLVNEKFLLTGDTLFVESVGRPDLSGKARKYAKDLYGTLFKKLFPLPEEIKICPAHYASRREMEQSGLVIKTLGELKGKNPVLKTLNQNEFMQLILKELQKKPKNFREIRKVNLGNLRVEEEKAREMELGPNRCSATTNERSG